MSKPKKPIQTSDRTKGVRIKEKPINMKNWDVDPKRIYIDIMKG